MVTVTFQSTKIILNHYLVPFLRQASTFNTTKKMAEQSPDCVFCKICNGQEQSEIVYKDDEFVVFPDIKPAAKHHYLVVTQEHIQNVKHISKDQKPIVERLVQVGRQVLSEKGADLSDVRFGFHWPPFNSIQHLHLHAISPASNMGFIARQIFRPGTWWFVTPDYVLSRL